MESCGWVGIGYWHAHGGGGLHPKISSSIFGAMKFLLVLSEPKWAESTKRNWLALAGLPPPWEGSGQGWLGQIWAY